MLLKTILVPEKPAPKSFQETVTTLQEHYFLSPKPLEIAERFCFYKQHQLEGKSIKFLSYVAELKKLATHSNFGANLNKAL